MKKAIVTFSILGIFTALVWAFPILAQNGDERPKGLDDRGPLTKITFIHHKKGYAKPAQVGKPKATACYGFLANGAKWKTTEDYRVNPTNPDGLNDNDVMNAVDAGVSEWENYGGNSIFGNSIKDPDITYNESMDGKNSASFGPYADSGVIAVTNVWGYFGGPPQTRALVEWDMLFNTDSSWTWGDATSNPLLMDLRNIATHELGHSAGMDDLYNTSCNLETMFGYSTEGDIIKRTLNDGDITGIQKLY
ncbi:MAG: hypothetical protein A2900_02880 [Candidatus Chisholmbacteria bacterium RIFCSPLOWO2_01_FULL_50_28]|uniref:Peptidase M10 metallopeptidase domain-containing protein n=1 Tax=Candidatus Chisholmbacteria bacterium RIFCSPHIGHO2_01_FULL_52_32 TaxID=1797591 RepID=A0A1G1VTT1_9BACT|nr:MAG: hypothetical protein A2786_03865 [Candidatus Chisholmbacteria bacterium RIFCSPHIGHO2_01_FULL_52_32]OGY20022.1 MAG: hypothetical protein A2900_02880 [Candidatus Chisholmbacteria bacterium RIFCSPLOWO2_01_FULL_50_28]